MNTSRSRNGSDRKAARVTQIRASQRRRRLGLLIVLLVVALGLLTRPFFTPTIATAQTPTAQALLQQTWQRAKESGAYSFDANIVQIQRPLLTVLSPGKTTKRDTLTLEGSSNLAEQSLEMTLWTQGGTVLDKNSGIQIRIAGDTAHARQGNQPWQEIDNFAGLFAPNNDFMTYLVAATNVQNQGLDTRAGLQFTRLTFDIDGLAYARAMRDQMQAEMAQRGELQQGAELSLLGLYRNMTGQGELWLDAAGLPLRQLIQLDFAPEGDQQISAEISVTFHDFAPLATAASSTTLLSQLTNSTPAQIAATANQLATASYPMLIALLLVSLFLATLLYSRRSRHVLAALQLSIILSMLTGPLLQSAHAQQIFTRQQNRLIASDARAQDSGMTAVLQSLQNKNTTAVSPTTLTDILNDSGLDSDHDGYTDIQEQLLGTNPKTNPALGKMLPAFMPVLADTPTQSLPANNGTDTDGDGLTDYVEALLGTTYTVGGEDSDGDHISDYQEVTGFTYNNTHWVTDPLEMDSNRDGISDGQEWAVNTLNNIPADTDNDGTPDLFDNDNDNDGVPDKYDLSPNTAVPNTFDGNNPFALVLNGLEANKITYVEFQLRPVITDHLQLTYNAFDWPNDLQGTIQDGNQSTEDIRLVPMLEIIVPAGASHLLPLDLLEQYSIMVKPLPGGEQAVYVPLTLVTENRGSGAAAFNGKMIYNGDPNWGDVHQTRLIWMVQAQNDVCDTFDDAGLCSNYSGYDIPQIVHTYEDSWRLTGFNVLENHWTDIATIYEDPAVDNDTNNDSALWLLSHGLDLSFIAGGVVTGTQGTRLWDIEEIANRFDHTTNSAIPAEQRWHISNTLSVATAAYSHLDEASPPPPKQQPWAFSTTNSPPIGPAPIPSAPH